MYNCPVRMGAQVDQRLVAQLMALLRQHSRHLVALGDFGTRAAFLTCARTTYLTCKVGMKVSTSWSCGGSLRHASGHPAGTQTTGGTQLMAVPVFWSVLWWECQGMTLLSLWVQ